MERLETCLFITETGVDDFGVFANIYVNHELEFLETLGRINDLLHRNHDKVYYYPNISEKTARTIVNNYAEDYPCYTITIKKGI